MEHEAPKEEFSPLNILLADDDPDDRFFFEEALKQLPIASHVITVNNGEELMDYLFNEETILPDILFLDINMPRKTGFECLVEIKNATKLSRLPVVMFTTSFTRGVEIDDKLSDTLANLGASDFIRKPSGFQEVKNVLHDALTRIIAKEKLNVLQQDVVNQPGEAMQLKQMNVLLAEDDIDDCHFFKSALKSVPFSTRLTTVPDGDKLMAYLYDNIDHLPHVLFLDINMPCKNGFECLAEIKKDKKLADLPVIMFSTSGEPDQIKILFNAGADMYIRKPANFAALVQVIHHALPIATENIFSNGKLKYIFNP